MSVERVERFLEKQNERLRSRDAELHRQLHEAYSRAERAEAEVERLREASHIKASFYPDADEDELVVSDLDDLDGPA